MGNWRKMLWRFWVLASALWLGFMTVAALLFEGSELSRMVFWDKAAFMLLPPLVVLALGRAMVWVVDGLME